MRVHESTRQGDQQRCNASRALLTVLLLIQTALAEAATESAERIAWRKAPIALELQVGTERLVHFPGAVQVGLPPHLQAVLRVQSIAGTLYLLASQPISSTRIVVRSLEGGPIYLLDLSATLETTSSGPVLIYDPDDEQTETEHALGVERDVLAYGYVTLTRFAAQQLYAPARLLKDLPGVVRVPVKRQPAILMRGGAVKAIPLIAWRAGDLFLTAVRLTNTTGEPQVLDPRTLRGAWLAATFQHNRLQAAGSEADRTVVYLISARPFVASL